jgi:subtilase family serine protease
MIREIALLLTIAALVLAANSVLMAQRQSLLTRHVPEVTLNGQAEFVGRLPATQSMRIDIVLPVRAEAGLDSFLQEVYDPSSSNYRHFLTVERFTERFGPSQADFEALVHFARTNGFTVTGGSRDAMDLQMQGPVAIIETAFHINMGLYHDSIGNRDFYAPDREPVVDLPFQLMHISGLDNYSIPRPELVRRPPGIKAPASTGSCPQQSFCGSDMRAAYYEGTSLTGKGQNIGLLEFHGFEMSDVNRYYKNAKQERTGSIFGISVDGSPLKCLYSKGCDDSEQILDITQALGMAPEANVYVFVGRTDTAVLASMSSHEPLPLNLSSCWSAWGTDFTTDDMYFKKMAAQGQSFFAAAGDSGKWKDKYLQWPMESQYVISVGGTDLTTKGPGKAWSSETVWVSGGGGISPDHVPIPSWQKAKGIITKANDGSTKYRNGPDVSANANVTFYVCADQIPCNTDNGGTSFAAPMWAGYLALANEEAATAKLPPPGFINPAIYKMGLERGYKTDFHDITIGTNGFPATKGYDLASGWGSPNKSGLINALLGTNYGKTVAGRGEKGEKPCFGDSKCGKNETVF